MSSVYKINYSAAMNSIILLIGFTMLVGCGPSDEVLAARDAALEAKLIAHFEERLAAEQLTGEVGIVGRVTKLEDSFKGIGYATLAHAWRAPWDNPDLRCYGPEDNRRAFDKSPARLNLGLSWSGGGRIPTKVPISVRESTEDGHGGAIVFSGKAIQTDGSGFIVDVPNVSCNQIFSIGINTTAPARL